MKLQHRNICGVLAGEPMVRMAEQVIPHFSPGDQIERLGVSPQAQDFENVDLAGHIHVLRQPFGPALAPFRAEHPLHLQAQPPLNGFDYLGDPVVVFERAHMLVEIPGPGHAATKRVHLRSRQAIQVVKLHRCQRRAQFHQFLRRLVELATFVVGADDEYAHVPRLGGFDRRPVQVVHEIPMQVHVVELPAVDGVEDNVGGGMSGEADEAGAAFLLELARGGQAAAFAERELEELAVIDAVQRQQVHVIQPQILERRVERAQEFLGGGLGSDLGLDDDFLAGQSGEEAT